jgi:uncharacterized Zn finger protein (UPF0148 family)
VDEVDACPRCGSRHLVRRLGRTVCPACGADVDASVEASPGRAADRETDGNSDVGVVVDSAVDADGELAKEVAAAIERVLGRGPSVTPPRS